MTDKIQVAIRIKKDLWQWIQNFCRSNGLTVTGLLTTMVLKLRDNEGKKSKSNQ